MIQNAKIRTDHRKKKKKKKIKQRKLLTCQCLEEREPAEKAENKNAAWHRREVEEEKPDSEVVGEGREGMNIRRGETRLPAMENVG